MKRIYLTGYKSSPARYVYTYNALMKIKRVNLSSQFFVEGDVIKKNSLLKNLIAFVISKYIFVGPMEHRIYLIVISKILGKKVICDIYAGLFNSTVIDRKLYSADSIKGMIQFWRDKLAFKYSDICIFLTDHEKELFIQSVGLSSADVNAKIIPLVTNVKMKAKLPYFNSDSKIITICWTGSYIPLQGLDIIIRAMYRLKADGLNYRFIVFGPNDMRSLEFKKMVHTMELEDRVIFSNIWGNLDEWEKQVSTTCDIALGIFGQSNKAKAVLANKVVDSVSFRMPVITGYSSGSMEYFDGKDNLFYCAPDPDALAKKIVEVMQLNQGKIKLHVENAFNTFEKYFTISQFESKIYNMVLEL